MSRPQAVRSRTVRLAAAMMAGWAAFLWPTMVNDGAFLLPDTTAYMRGADAVVETITGRRTGWSDETARIFVHQTSPAAIAGTNVQGDTSRVVLAGRSIYYGIPLYVCVMLGGFVAVAMLQAALCVGCATMVAVRIGLILGRPTTPALLALVLVATGLLTSIGYFAGYMTPDIFAPLGALALAALLAFRGRMSPRESWLWWSVLVAALCVHSANLLIFLLASGLLGIGFLVAKRRREFPLLLVGGAVLIGLVAEFLFALGVETATDQRPVRPPFVAARLIDDGAGRAYLRERCAGSTFLLCEWRDRIPQGSDVILWSEIPGVASFASASSADKRRVAREELPFIVAVFLDRPSEVIRGSLKAVGVQAGQWSLSEFNTDASARAFFERKIPPQLRAEIGRTSAWRETMPVQFSTWAIRISFGVALLLAALATIGWRVIVPDRIRLFLAVLMVVIGCDILVTGVLSTPHDRYLVRISWILPFAILTLLAHRQTISGGKE